jgi:hypothetical protein
MNTIIELAKNDAHKKTNNLIKSMTMDEKFGLDIPLKLH